MEICDEIFATGEPSTTGFQRVEKLFASISNIIMTAGVKRKIIATGRYFEREIYIYY